MWVGDPQTDVSSGGRFQWFTSFPWRYMYGIPDATMGVETSVLVYATVVPGVLRENGRQSKM